MAIFVYHTIKYGHLNNKRFGRKGGEGGRKKKAGERGFRTRCNATTRRGRRRKLSKSMAILKPDTASNRPNRLGETLGIAFLRPVSYSGLLYLLTYMLEIIAYSFFNFITIQDSILIIRPLRLSAWDLPRYDG